MTKCNAVSLSGSCGCGGCGWYDNWSCGSWNGCGCGCANGCNTGCLNGCGGGCANGCGTCGSCGGCACWRSSDCSGRGACCGGCANCACLWPDVPALPTGGVLTPRIIGTGRLCTRVNDLTLCVQDIPECAVTPYALVSVSASGPVDWEFVAVERWRAVLRVTIPLTATIRDCNGCTFTGHSSITVEVPVRISIPTTDLGRAHVAVQPGVRLLCVSGCSEDGCFTVSLAVLVDVYVARWEPSSDGVTIPCRPDLPLTLPPSFHNGCNSGCGCGNTCTCW